MMCRRVKTNARMEEPQADLHLIPHCVMEELGFVRDESSGKCVVVAEDESNGKGSSSG